MTTNITPSSVVVDDVIISEPVFKEEIEAEVSVTDNIIPLNLDVSGTIEIHPEVVTRIDHGDYDEYQGAYEVTPLARTEQTLETANKLMTDDVTVHKVPYYETSNPYGTTVYIAEG